MGFEAKSRHRYAAFAWPHDVHSPSLRHYWEQLSAQRKTPGAVYQSTAFFEYLKATGDKDRLSVIAIIDRNTDAIVGVVPMQKAVLELPFSIGEHTLLCSRVKSLILLGGEPMVPADADALDSLFLLVAQHFRRSQVIEMDAVPREGFLWNYLNSSKVVKDNFDLHVLHGFRDCHAVEIPASTEEYYRRFSKKRRYNLLRQEKLLQDHVGAPLELIVVEGPDGVGEVHAALKFLGAGADESVLHTDFAALARSGLLSCFILKAGERIIGLAPGTRSGRILRIHCFFHDRSLERYSPGAALWQLTFRHLIRSAEFTNVDMGYGTPAYRYSATNTVVQKGKVLLFRRSLANRARIAAHSGYSSAVNLLKRRRAESQGGQDS